MIEFREIETGSVEDGCEEDDDEANDEGDDGAGAVCRRRRCLCRRGRHRQWQWWPGKRKTPESAPLVGFVTMQRILDQLRAHADAAPDNALLTHTIAALLDVQRRPHGPHSVSWDALSRDFQRLRDHELWEPSTENDELLDALRVLLTSPSHMSPRESVEPHQTPLSGEKVSVVNVIPSPGVSSQLVSNRDHLVLPVELIDVLNNAYFLHILATDPAQILPPGKSLLSVMSRARSTADGDPKPTLHSKVEDIAHKAFWDEVRTSPLTPYAYG